MVIIEGAARRVVSLRLSPALHRVYRQHLPDRDAASHVRFGSEADVTRLMWKVCFITESRHWRTANTRPLCAITQPASDFRGTTPSAIVYANREFIR